MPSELALQSLRDLYASPGLSNMGARVGPAPNIKRNQAKAQADARALGDPSLADGSISQVDLADAAQSQEEDALKRLLAPVQARGQFGLQEEALKGQGALNTEQLRGQNELAVAKQQGIYGVEAAKQHALANAANTQMLIGGRQGVADTNQAGIAARSQANLKSQALRQRYQLVATGKEKAPVGFFEGLMPGSQAAAQQKLLAEIQQQIDAAEAGGAPNDPGEAPAQAGGAPSGETAAQQLARLRAGRR